MAETALNTFRAVRIICKKARNTGGMTNLCNLEQIFLHEIATFFANIGIDDNIL